MNSNLDFDYNLAGKKSLMKEDEKEYVLAEVSAEYEDEMGKGIFNFRKMQQCKWSEIKTSGYRLSNTGGAENILSHCQMLHQIPSIHKKQKAQSGKENAWKMMSQAAKKMPDRLGK